MIDTGIDTAYKAEEQKEIDFSPIPEGEYEVKVKKIDDWKEVKSDVKNYLRDEKGNIILDDKGKKKFELVKDCKFYNANMQLEVMSGPYEKRIIFHRLTTHPNMNYTIAAFLNAIGVDTMKASEIPSKCVGEELIAKIAVETYEKRETNKQTGMLEFIPTKKNVIKNLKPIEKASILIKSEPINFDEIK